MPRVRVLLIALVLAMTASGVGLAQDGLFRISTPADPNDPSPDRYHPAVAYNTVHDEYLVVWHNTWPGGERDIYAQRIGRSGALHGSWFCVSCGANDRFAPNVAYDWAQDAYLVVWMYDALGDGTRMEVRGRLLPWNGPGSNPELLIHAPSDSSGWGASAAYDSIRQRFLVSWDKTSTGLSFTTQGVWFRTVATNGTMGVSNQASGTTNAYQNDLTYNVAMDEYFVVWLAGLTDIVGARITGAGARVGLEFVIAGGDSSQRRHPSLATDTQAIYMVAWEKFVGSDWDVYGAFQPSSDPDWSTPGGFVLVGTLADETAPETVATSMDGGFMLVYQQTNVSSNQSLQRILYGASWNGVDMWVVLALMPPIFDFAFSDAEAPAAISTRHETLVVFEEEDSDPTVERHIWGWSERIFRDGFESGNTQAWE